MFSAKLFYFWPGPLTAAFRNYEDQSKLETKLDDVPRLTQKDLKPHEVLIKVDVASSNPKALRMDWKVSEPP